MGASLVEEVHRAAEVGNHDRAADDEGDVEALPEFLIGATFFDGAVDVVGDAIVAAEDHGSDEAEEFLGLDVEGAGLVAVAVEVEEAFGVQCRAGVGPDRS